MMRLLTYLECGSLEVLKGKKVISRQINQLASEKCLAIDL